MRRVLAGPVRALPVLELPARHDVARVGKGRHPAPVLETGIPAHVVPVQMRAHDVIDFLGLHPGAGEIGEEGRTQPVELRPRRALLVVAEAGIDQDGVAAGPDDERVEAEDQLAGRRIDEPRSRHVRVLPQHCRVEIGKEGRRLYERPLELGDALHLESADARRIHITSRDG